MSKLRLFALCFGLISVPYFAYTALGHRVPGTHQVSGQVLILVMVTFVYMWRCVRTIQRSTLHRNEWLRFVLVSLVLLAIMILNFASIFRALGLAAGPGSGAELDADGLCHSPFECLYFTIITWTTVGYGDLVPSPAARPYAATEAMVGYFFTAFFVPTLIYATTVLRRNPAPNQPQNHP